MLSVAARKGYQLWGMESEENETCGNGVKRVG